MHVELGQILAYFSQRHSLYCTTETKSKEKMHKTTADNSGAEKPMQSAGYEHVPKTKRMCKRTVDRKNDIHC